MAIALRSALTDARSSAIPHAAVRPSTAGIWAIGRIEARKMLLHPSFMIGTAFGLLIMRGAIGSGGNDIGLIENVQWLMLGALAGLVLATVLSANIAALRPRRSGTQELFGSLPAPPETLTVGLLAGVLLGPALIATVLTAVGWFAFRSEPDIGPHINVFLAVQLPFMVAALGAIGIGVGRWIPSLFGGPIVIILHIFTGVIWAVPWVVPSSVLGDKAPWHLVYLLAALTTWVALALARDRRTAWRFVVAAVAFAIGVAAALLQVPEGGW
jgi:hypothetical protein